MVTVTALSVRFACRLRLMFLVLFCRRMVSVRVLLVLVIVLLRRLALMSWVIRWSRVGLCLSLLLIMNFSLIRLRLRDLALVLSCRIVGLRLIWVRTGLGLIWLYRLVRPCVRVCRLGPVRC